MRRPLLILTAALALATVLFCAAFYCARHVSVQQMAQSTDDLDWLRMEFRLSETELARVRELHEGYLPLCIVNCQSIAHKKSELAQAVAAGTNPPATLDALRAEVAAIRAKCQSEMIAHFEEVSQAMPPQQGRRYLAEMKRLTLGEHERVEESMSEIKGDGHHHH